MKSVNNFAFVFEPLSLPLPKVSKKLARDVREDASGVVVMESMKLIFLRLYE